ncbi:hypothetical protein JYU34_011134 [Plutella xylostella]|uniref:Uncharacterized protein n=1 Tax=Plutella xylostella TaxID=51655 RepID=A0ABQ7QG53_PLUXY|nr:hypothetical protein JYU34_011134 [Plutella xylostella]
MTPQSRHDRGRLHCAAGTLHQHPLPASWLRQVPAVAAAPLVTPRVTVNPPRRSAYPLRPATTKQSYRRSKSHPD